MISKTTNPAKKDASKCSGMSKDKKISISK
jgi:hypothetical protein